MMVFILLFLISPSPPWSYHLISNPYLPNANFSHILYRFIDFSYFPLLLSPCFFSFKLFVCLDISDKTSFVISTFVSPFPSHLCHTRRQNFLTSIEPWTLKMLPLLCCSISMHSSIFWFILIFFIDVMSRKQHRFHWLKFLPYLLMADF